MSRTSVAHLLRPIDLSTGEMQLFQVGANWTRTSYKKDPVSGIYLPGVLLEPEAENKALQSQTFATTWTKLDAGDTITNNNADAPNGRTEASTLVADATDGDHGVSQAITVTAAGWVFSVFAKKGDRDWLYLSDDTVANATGYFDLANGVVGTKGAGMAAIGIEDWGNDWYRCWGTFTGTAAAHTFKIQTADADGDKSIQGDGGTTNTYLFGAQVELGTYPSSYIPTVGSAVTRTADSALVYTLGSEMAKKEWTLLVPVAIPAHTPSSNLKLLSIYKNGAAGTDHVTLWADTSKRAYLTSAASGKSAGAVTVTSSDICDGEIHWVSIHVKDGQLHCFVQSNDDQYHAADLDAGIAPDLDRLSVEPSGGWVGGVQMEMRFRHRMPRSVQPQLLRV